MRVQELREKASIKLKEIYNFNVFLYCDTGD